MPRPSNGEAPMTGAERQVRYRASHADGAPVIRIRRATDRRSRIRRWNDTIAALVNLKDEYSHWLDDCRTISRTAPRRRPYGRSSSSISLIFWRSNHREASAVIEQRDGPIGMGHDDAWRDDRLQLVIRMNHAWMPG